MLNLINFKGTLQQDNVLVSNEVKQLNEILSMPTRKGYDKAIISNGTLVNIVSNIYGHLPNENYFLAVEEKLINAGIEYVTRSINRNDRSFAVDYILTNNNLDITIGKGIGLDKIKPMLRFTNSYDGSAKTSGHFGYFREVCTNGLHIAETKLAFSVKHKGDICEVVLPQIDNIINEFMNNEYYSLKNKAELLSNVQLTDVQKFVNDVCKKTNIFKFEKSDKNIEPSLNSTIVMDTIRNEANLLGIAPNLWLGYNAFNSILHTKFEKSFDIQKTLDASVFNTVVEMA
jgi:hypothetical protein